MKSRSTRKQISKKDFGVCHLLNIDSSPTNDKSAKKEPVSDIKVSSDEPVLIDNQKTCTNSEKKTEETLPPVELTSSSSNKENSGDIKNEIVPHNDILKTNEKTEEKVEKGATPKKGKNGKTAKTPSVKKTEEKKTTTPKESVKKPKSDTKKKKKAESEEDHGGSEEEKVKTKTKPTLLKSKSEVITTQRKSRGVSKEEFEKYSNLLNQKTHRKKK